MALRAAAVTVCLSLQTRTFCEVCLVRGYPERRLVARAGAAAGQPALAPELVAFQLGHTDGEGRPYTHLLRRVYVHPDHEAALERIECAIAR